VWLMAEHLHSKFKTLSSVPSTRKGKNQKTKQPPKQLE
jgi:hypothetical protein